MDLLPKDLFSHEECPGHVFNTKRMVKDNFIMDISLCLLCYYTSGSMEEYPESLWYTIIIDIRSFMRDLDSLEHYNYLWDDVWILENKEPSGDNEETSGWKLPFDQDQWRIYPERHC